MGILQSAGLTLVSFAILISVIVFFHELGHLVVGKWLGVKAVRFSIGFGPRLFGVQWGETEYRVSLLPLGGYVKFAGDNPLEELPPEDRGRGFLEQPPQKKAAIAFAGPAANFVLAVLLFFWLSATPHPENMSIVGFVKPGSPAAAAGVKPFDRISAVDGEKISGWAGLQEKIHGHAGEPITITVERGGQTLSLHVTPAVHEESNPIETVKQGMIGITAVSRTAEIAVEPSSPAARAGLRTFDIVTRIAGQPVSAYDELEQKLADARGPVEIEALRRHEVLAPGAILWSDEPVRTTVALDGSSTGIRSADLTLFVVEPGSAAAEAGLRRGDRVVSLNGTPVGWWFDVEAARKAAGATPLAFTVKRDGQLLTVTVRQHLRRGRDDTGARAQLPELGAAPDMSILTTRPPPPLVWVRYSPAEAFRRGVDSTVGASRVMVLGFARMFTGRISTDAIGGPLMIADVARQAADEGWRNFVAVMALISVNLGLLNLIPIPVLDGFHVLSAAIEGVRRRPLSLRFREIANLVGVALVVGLMLFALRNDAMRKFFE
jgi:regulator of sigma E protease